MMTTGWLSIAQTLIFFGSLFFTRVSEERGKLYRSIMPEICYYSSYISCVGFNVIIVILNLVSYFTQDEKNAEVVPFMVFTILVQITIAVNFMLFIRGSMDFDFARSKRDRTAY